MANYGYGEVPALPKTGVRKSDPAALDREQAKHEAFVQRAIGLEKAAGGAVKVRMPSGAILTCGGQCLITALTNGGQPVDETLAAGVPAPDNGEKQPRIHVW